MSWFNLGEMLKNRGLSRKKFAELLGVKPTVVSRFFKHGYDPQASTLLLWAEILNCSLDDLVDHSLHDKVMPTPEGRIDSPRRVRRVTTKIPADLKRFVLTGRLLNVAKCANTRDTLTHIRQNKTWMVTQADGRNIVGCGKEKAKAILNNLSFVQSVWPEDYAVIEPHLKSLRAFAERKI